MNKILFEVDLHDGLFLVKERDTSYWNLENGPNREDTVCMYWVKENKEYKIGSHVSLGGALKWVSTRVKDKNKFMESIYEN